MTKDEAREIAALTVTETLKAMGLDPADLHATQADFLYLRKSRKGAEQVATWVKRSAVGAASVGVIYAVVEGVKMAVRGS